MKAIVILSVCLFCVFITSCVDQTEAELREIEIPDTSMVFHMDSFPSSSKYPVNILDNDIFKYKIKQLEQFMDRFNLYEDAMGIKVNLPNQNAYCMQGISSLFDKKYSEQENDSLLQSFIQEVCENVLNLKMEDSLWYCQVSFEAIYSEDPIIVDINLKFQVNKDSTVQWVIVGMNADFLEMNVVPNNSFFLYPNAHELRFLRLKMALKQKANVIDLMRKNFLVDFNSILLFLLHTDQLNFVKVIDINFHFLQFSNWAFQVRYFDRLDYNSGWLIHDIERMTDIEKNKFLVQELHITARELLLDSPILEESKNNTPLFEEIDFSNERALRIVYEYVNSLQSLLNQSNINCKGLVDNVLEHFNSAENRVVDDLNQSDSMTLISIRKYLEHIVMLNANDHSVCIDYEVVCNGAVSFEMKDDHSYALLPVQKIITIGNLEKRILETIIVDLSTYRISATTNANFN